MRLIAGVCYGKFNVSRQKSLFTSKMAATNGIFHLLFETSPSGRSLEKSGCEDGDFIEGKSERTPAIWCDEMSFRPTRVAGLQIKFPGGKVYMLASKHGTGRSSHRRSDHRGSLAEVRFGSRQVGQPFCQGSDLRGAQAMLLGRHWRSGGKGYRSPSSEGKARSVTENWVAHCELLI